MERIELWVEDFEFGDAIIDDTAFNYLSATDSGGERQVFMMMNARTTEQFLAAIDNIRAHLAAAVERNRN